MKENWWDCRTPGMYVIEDPFNEQGKFGISITKLCWTIYDRLQPFCLNKRLLWWQPIPHSMPKFVIEVWEDMMRIALLPHMVMFGSRERFWLGAGVQPYKTAQRVYKQWIKKISVLDRVAG